MGPTRIVPVILSGGAGTRLWPLSRELHPKQFLPLTGPETLLQQTVRRVADPGRFAAPFVICNNEHRFVIAEQLRQIGISPAAIVLEPVGRNTAPAATVAALYHAALDRDALLLLLPADHAIGDEAAFLAAVDRAAEAARAGNLVTFGIRPAGPETGYGYIRRGAALPDCPGAARVERFVEKPDRPTAEAFLRDGAYDWNSGMFLFAAGTFLEEIARADAAILQACAAALEHARRDLDFLRLDAAAFAAAPARSVDYAVMEHTTHAAVVPVEMGWSDVGSWPALLAASERDAAGNATHGDTLLQDAANCYVRAEDGLVVAAIGTRDLIVVATGDAVLVADRTAAQDVKGVVERLKRDGRSAATAHRRVYRPWGSYALLDRGDRFQVKHIVVRPGHGLSLQSHRRRAEHWVVVRGTARVTRGDTAFLLHENESAFIPLGTVHRLENPGEETLQVIEVASGTYLGEDDIERLDDRYGRAENGGGRR